MRPKIRTNPRRRRRTTPGVLAAAGALTGAAIPVLARMRRELLTTGALSPPTTAAMYTIYAGHAAATITALATERRPAPPRAVQWAGLGLTTGGAALCMAGMSRFAGTRQISGTDTGPFINSGIYRISRNPQYLGYTAALTGLATARRSPTTLALTATITAAYRWWIPVEEQHLHHVFGAEYDNYRAHTTRWLGPPKTP